MRILHTADWHLGKTLKGIDRTEEVAKALDEVLRLVKSERVDLVVAAGDLFDRPQVSAAAEAVFFDFVLALYELGVPLFAVAGNHDPRLRFSAWREVLARFGAEVAAELRFFEEGGVKRKGELSAALLPFLSERLLVKAEEVWEKEEGERMGSYAERMRRVLLNLAQGFSQETANLLVAHLTLEGARPGGGEFAFFLGKDYAVPPDALPLAAGYVALGHIHRMQRVSEAPLAYYSGSLIQLDFGEGEEAERGALLVELAPGRPARVLAEVKERWGKPLRTFRLSPEELGRRDEEIRRFPGYVKVVLKGRPDPVLREKLLEIPQVLEVVFEVPGEAAREEVEPVERLGFLEAYKRYHEEAHGAPPEAELLDAFRRALEEAGDAPAQP